MYTFTIKSHTDPATSYTVTFPDEPGTQPYCTCKGYGYRRTCSHIKEAAQAIQDQLDKLVVPSAFNDMSGLQHYCTSCSAILNGTHALLDKCAACYREATFAGH